MDTGGITHGPLDGCWAAAVMNVAKAPALRREVEKECCNQTMEQADGLRKGVGDRLFVGKAEIFGQPGSTT